MGGHDKNDKEKDFFSGIAKRDLNPESNKNRDFDNILLLSVTAATVITKIIKPASVTGNRSPPLGGEGSRWCACLISKGYLQLKPNIVYKKNDPSL